ncbi:MAG: hypothetical protein CM15mP6_1810 [Methanobacteriota archaeon]|nr:MAG: hypothetical protein CM15mP6_1810 [Euryarchaeota archaeon]
MSYLVEDTVKCDECGSRNLSKDESRGEVVCDDCGLVLEDKVIDQGAEWRVFSPEQGDQRARTGAPMTVMLHDKGLSTDIDWQNKDYSGKSISSRYRSQFYRMRKWQKRSRVSNATERNKAMALAELDRMASRLDLPKTIRETAAVTYGKAVDARLIAVGRLKESQPRAYMPHAGFVRIRALWMRLGRLAEPVERRLVVPIDSWSGNLG